MSNSEQRKERQRKKRLAEEKPKLEAALAKAETERLRVELNSKESTPKKRRFFTNRRLVIIGIILTVGVGAWETWPTWSRVFYSKKQNYDRDHFQEGDLDKPKIASPESGANTTSSKENNSTWRTDPLPIIPHAPHINGIVIDKFKDSIFLNGGAVAVTMGNRTQYYGAQSFVRGEVDVFGKSSEDCAGDKPILLGVQDGRLYISVEFKGLKDELSIGTIEFNHWKLWNDRMTYKDSPTKLEVRDLQHQIVMSVEYLEDSPEYGQVHLNINGYLIGPSKIAILKAFPSEANIAKSNAGSFLTCYNKTEVNWKMKAEKDISKIKSIFGDSTL